MKQTVLMIMELTMKIHLLVLGEASDDRFRFEHKFAYLRKVKKKHDPTIVDDWKVFCENAKQIINDNPDKKYVLLGDYMNKTHLLHIEPDHHHWSPKPCNAEIGWHKLKQLANKIFGEGFEVTHKKFHDKVYITKKV